MKETHYYFSHDCNARRDPKIVKMVLEHGMEGYGWYWVILEMMREQTGWKLNISDDNDIAVIAIQARTKPKKMKKFLDECVTKFKLFKKNKKYLWSKTFLNRMRKMQEKIEKARKSAKIRWSGLCENDATADADAMRTQCERNAIKEKKIKENKRKDKESINNNILSNINKKQFALSVYLTEKEHKKLVDGMGDDLTKEYIKDLSLYIQSKGKKYKSHYATILSWHRKNVKEGKVKRPQDDGEQPKYIPKPKIKFTPEQIEENKKKAKEIIRSLAGNRKGE